MLHRSLRSFARPALAGVAATVLFAATGCEPATESTTTNTSAETTDMTDATATQIAFRVDGMSCENCVAAIASAVNKLDGVTGCDISLDDAKAVVTTTDASSGERIAAAISALGFDVAADAGDAAGETAGG